jgi:integrase
MTQDPPVLNVTRAVIHRGGRTIVDTPKSAAGVRAVHVPPHLAPALTEHLEKHAQSGPDGLLFPSPATKPRSGCGCGYPSCGGGHLTSPQLYHRYLPARNAAGQPDLRWHDLRHTGAVEVARQGATLAETMARLGHSTVSAAMRYQHATKERDAELARRLSQKRLRDRKKG